MLAARISSAYPKISSNSLSCVSTRPESSRNWGVSVGEFLYLTLAANEPPTGIMTRTSIGTPRFPDVSISIFSVVLWGISIFTRRLAI
jgi:hypothetical protein